jgi:hypothetical protein
MKSPDVLHHAPPNRHNSCPNFVGHTILVIAYHLLRDGGVYRDLGPAYFDERDRSRVRHRLVQRLENLGYTVSLTVLPT